MLVVGLIFVNDVVGARTLESTGERMERVYCMSQGYANVFCNLY